MGVTGSLSKTGAVFFAAVSFAVVPPLRAHMRKRAMSEFRTLRRFVSRSPGFRDRSRFSVWIPWRVWTSKISEQILWSCRARD